MSGNGPPGLGGFGDVGQPPVNYQEIVKGMKRLKDIETHMEADAINVERYVKELPNVCRVMFRATGAMFEQEHLRFAAFSLQPGAGETEEVTGSTEGL